MNNEVKPGDKEFFMIRNGDIWNKVVELEKFVTQLKSSLYVISFIITPLVSTVAATIVGWTLA